MLRDVVRKQTSTSVTWADFSLCSLHPSPCDLRPLRRQPGMSSEKGHAKSDTHIWCLSGPPLGLSDLGARCQTCPPGALGSGERCPVSVVEEHVVMSWEVPGSTERLVWSQVTFEHQLMVISRWMGQWKSYILHHLFCRQCFIRIANVKLADTF